jgi:hypothetical protein
MFIEGTASMRTQLTTQGELGSNSFQTLRSDIADKAAGPDPSVANAFPGLDCLLMLLTCGSNSDDLALLSSGAIFEVSI